MFTLAISCLTTSNLPWLMHLTLWVLMRCYSLQHWNLLSPQDISTTGFPFCFGSITSFFIQLFLCSSPVAYWTPTDMGGSSFSVVCFCLFILFKLSWGLKARLLKWFAIPFSSWPHYFRLLLAGTCLSAASCSQRTCLAPWFSCWWSSWVCNPSLAAGCWSMCHPGAWAKALLELLAGAHWCWRMPSSEGLRGLSAASRHPGANPLPRSHG